MADRTALFVRIPAADAERLDRAAFELKASKQDLVAGLVARYVDPATAEGLDALRTIAGGLELGRHEFPAAEPAPAAPRCSPSRRRPTCCASAMRPRGPRPRRGRSPAAASAAAGASAGGACSSGSRRAPADPLC